MLTSSTDVNTSLPGQTTEELNVTSSIERIEGSLSLYINKMLKQASLLNDALWQLSSNVEHDNARTIVNYIIHQEYSQANTQAETVGATLLEFHDINKTYYILHFGLEKLINDEYKSIGGTYIFYPKGNNIAIQVPHPIFDTNTKNQGIETYLNLESKYLLLAGTHRNSSSIDSNCQSNYKESDVAHNEADYFYQVHNALSLADNKILFIEFHGFGSDTRNRIWNECDSSKNVNIINISEGVDDFNSSNSIHRLATYLQNNSSIKVCLYNPSQDFNQTDIYTSSLGGTTNVSARFTNGVNDVCSVSAISSSSRFIHIEQSYEVRQNERATILNALKSIYLTPI
ncbi:MAG: hypothetical protein Q9M40_12360 [Sulfurimonas sp.]|nr:hypothetical protein [Sulfurimonas sp.]